MSHNPLPAAALDQHIAVLGKTGSGKTYAAKGIVEQLLDQKRQVCVIDPTSAWWGLRLAANGKSAGYDVVLLGGKHADIPLSERSGPAVARLVTQQRANVVLDTSGMTVGEYSRWFTDFASTLYTTVRRPLHLVIDEAHYFMPQGKIPDPQTGKMLHAGNRLMSGGRSLGIRGLMITQRPAKLHKDSLTCADTLIAMRMIAPQDRAAVKEWIDGSGDPAQGKEVLGTLAALPRGEGWVWYPEGVHLVLTKFPAIRTYDSSSTPKHGQHAGPAVAAIDLGEVKAAMAEAVKEAEANDPKLLRAEIAKLKAEAAKVKPAVQQVTKEVRVEVPFFDNVKAAALKKIAQAIHEKAEQIMATATPPITKEAFQEVGKFLKPLDSLSPVKQVSKPAPIVKRAEPSDNGTGELTAPQRRILDTVLMLNTRGIQVERDTVARWMGIHPNGGSYGANLGTLRADGYLEGFRLTEKGQAVVQPQETGIAGLNAALDGEPKRNIIRALLMNRQGLSREELASLLELHPNGGSYGANLGWLRTMGVITERGPIALTEGATA